MYRGGGKDNFIFFIYFLSNRYNSLTSFHVCISFIYIIYICVCISIFPSFFFLFANYLSIIFTWIERIFKQFVRKAWLA